MAETNITGAHGRKANLRLIVLKNLSLSFSFLAKSILFTMIIRPFFTSKI
jgi:hypothetical protein